MAFPVQPFLTEERSASVAAILDTIPVGLAVLRAPAFEYELANRAYLELAGGDANPIGRPLEVAHPALAALLAPQAFDVARTGETLETKDVPLPIRRSSEPAGRWVDLRVRALPVEPGRGRAVLVVAEETTSRVLARTRTEVLAGLAVELGEDRPVAELLARAATKARELLGADAAFVLLANADGRFGGRIDAGGLAVEVVAEVADLPAAALAMLRGAPVAFRADAAAGLEATWLRSARQGSALCVPVPGADRVLGLLYVSWTGGGAAAAADPAFAAAVASTCALAVRRARTLRREREAHLASRRATERLELLAESGALLSGTVDWRSVVRTTAQLGLGYLADVAVLDLFAADGVLRREAVESAGELPARASLASLEGREVESPAIHDALAARRTRRIAVPARATPDEGGDPDLATLDMLGATSCIVAPLVLRGRGAGALTLVRRAPSPPHDPEDVALATEIARRAALALDDARLIAAAAEEAAARDAFLAAAAHDIRSPLTALRLQVELLERSSHVGEEARPGVARLRSSVDRLSRRVEQVLEAARAVRAGPGVREALDLAELARAVVTRVIEERGRTASRVRVVAPDPVPGRWDRARVDAIVANLLAVATKRGAEEVEVRVTPDERGGCIEVSRPGIEHEAATSHVASAAAHEELEVGVWIARRFAEVHGGRLRVVRLPHAGARFTVHLRG